MEMVILKRNGVEKAWALKDVDMLASRGWEAVVAASAYSEAVDTTSSRPRVKLGKKDD